MPRTETAATCICNTGPDTDGPEEDCPEHGNVRLYSSLYRDASDFINRLRLIIYQDGQSPAAVRNQALALFEAGVPNEPEQTHDLVIELGDEEFWGHCSCGTTLGKPTRPNESFDIWAGRWERHVMIEVPHAL